MSTEWPPVLNTANRKLVAGIIGRRYADLNEKEVVLFAVFWVFGWIKCSPAGNVVWIN